MKSNFVIEYQWEKLLSSFNKDAWQTISMEYRKPAIYRWTVKDKRGSISYYIGESVQFRRRIRSYFVPGPTQHTSRRINELLTRQSKAGAKIKLEVLKINKFIINGKEYTESYLEQASFRKLIENLILTEHKRAKKEVHNL